jgi:hypothetical protein
MLAKREQMQDKAKTVGYEPRIGIMGKVPSVIASTKGSGSEYQSMIIY